MSGRAAAIWVSLLAFGAGAAATLPAEWEHWRYWRTIDAATGSSLVAAVLPPAVHGQARPSLADLRLIDGRGDELPYVLFVDTGERTVDWRSAELSEAGFVDGRYSQVVADGGSGDRVHDTLRVDVVEDDFFTWVAVEASDDRASWRLVRERAPIYRFKRDGLEGKNEIGYPPTRSRWLRLRLLAQQELTVRAVRIAETTAREPELEAWAAAARREADPPAGESRFRIDLGHEHVPVSAVRFATAAAEFHRPVVVSVRGESGDWRQVAEGDVYRYRAGGGDAASRERLEFRFAEDRGREWRVAIFDRSDAPIDDLRLELVGTPRRVVFRPESAPPFRLLYGNDRAEPPSYELARVTVREDWERASTVPLSDESENEAWVSPEPWTERHPLVLWAALGLAILVLGGLALRALGAPRH
ncbi:MAG TPA: DUF3999 family protein [Candidatus Polarisedimenticolaceae bacterium]|nr:DUF3999 family protein [Candidatus Polarisedimenticolaceae bacterium]